MSVSKRLIAEFVGTAIVVMAAAGAFTIHTGTQGQLGLVGIGILTGLAYLTAIYALGHISGAHFNPAITFAFGAIRKFSPNLIIPYVVAQLLGGIAGIGILRFVLRDILFDEQGAMVEAMSMTVQTGFLHPENIFIIELLIAFILMLVIMSLSTDKRSHDSGFNGLAVGLAIVMLTTLAAPLSGSALNPARAFGPAVWENNWQLAWIFWVAPLVGATLGAVVYEYLRIEPAQKGIDFGVFGPLPALRKRTRKTSLANEE